MKIIKSLSITTGSLIIAIATLLILAIVGYKYNEYSTIKKYLTLYNENWKEELRFTELSNNNGNEFLKIVNKNSTQSAETSYNYIEELSAINVIANNNEGYRDTLEKNKKEIAATPLNEFFIFGESKYFIYQLKSLQSKYYDLELKRNNRTLVAMYYLKNYNRFMVDYQILTDYDENGQKKTANYEDNFSKIQSLEKYYDSNYKFDNQDEIKAYLPKGYDVLNNYKNYFSSYYSLIKDYIAGDIDSASYKSAAVRQRGLNLGIDWDELFKDNEVEDAVKGTVEIIRDQSKLVKNFESRNGLLFPIIGKIGNFEEDLVMCQLYDFKTISLYQPLKNKYPVANTPQELLAEISSISPQTDELDPLFDKKVMKIINDKNKLSFICKDSKGEEFVYTTYKE